MVCNENTYPFIQVTERNSYTPVRVEIVTQPIQPTLCIDRLMLLKTMKNDTHTQNISYNQLLGAEPSCTNNPEQAA